MKVFIPNFKPFKMKCNLEKISQFFDSNKFEQDIKDFVLNMFKLFFDENNRYYNLKFMFFDLGFYEITKEDETEFDLDDEDDCRVIDFYKLSAVYPLLRKIIFNHFYKNVTDGSSTDFFDDFIFTDAKIVVSYKKWSKTNRKNKLKVLNDINN